MTHDEKQKVKRALRHWAEAHPFKDKPVLFVGLAINSYSPMELAAQVEKETDIGLVQLEVIEHAMRRYSLEEILEGFYASAGSMTHD